MAGTPVSPRRDGVPAIVVSARLRRICRTLRAPRCRAYYKGNMDNMGNGDNNDNQCFLTQKGRRFCWCLAFLC